MLTLLSGRAALWGTAVWENRHPCCSSFHSLSQEMRRVFDRALVGREAARMLADLRQGEQSVSDYSIQFRTLAAECEWNEKAQWDMFLHGLADRIHKRSTWWSYLSGWTNLWIGLTRGCTASATRSSRSTQVNTEISFLRHRRYGRSLVG